MSLLENCCGECARKAAIRMFSSKCLEINDKRKTLANVGRTLTFPVTTIFHILYLIS